MTILHDQPPLTQTSEPTSGEVIGVTDISMKLGLESVRQVTDYPEYETDADILFFNHESLQAATARIREVELADIDNRIHGANEAIAGIDTELAIQHDRLLAIEEYIDDLGWAASEGAASKKFNGYTHADTVRLIHALEEARESATEIADDLTEEKRVILAKLEKIEQKDFELLQKGR